MAKTRNKRNLNPQGNEASAKPRRGGRKPGKWTLVTPEQIRAYREQNKVSRARMAQMLGVSSTSVQNWETGTTASTKIQQRLAELIAAGAAAVLPARKAPSLWDLSEQGPGTEDAVRATGTIVVGYVGTKKDMSAEELVAVIRSVRQALS